MTETVIALCVLGGLGLALVLLQRSKGTRSTPVGKVVVAPPPPPPLPKPSPSVDVDVSVTIKQEPKS